MTEQVKIKCDIFWCQHNKVNEMSGKYQINLCNLSDAAVEALEGLGVEVKDATGDEKKGEMGKYITVKSTTPMKVYDTDGDEITEQIGNKSKAKAIITSYEWKYKNKKGVSPSLRKMVVTELVEYAAGGGDIDDDEVL